MLDARILTVLDNKIIFLLRRNDQMDATLIRTKFGDDYSADERAYLMGIDQRLTAHFARRLRGMCVLETCTGAGFTTIALARTARHVFTVEIDPLIQDKAVRNVAKAGLADNVTFISGSILDSNVLENIPSIDAAFMDPDWAITGPDHVHRFLHSTMRPPADVAFHAIFDRTPNIALVLPPSIDVRELEHLPKHERQQLYLDDSFELLCLYFGELAGPRPVTEYRVETRRGDGA